MVNQLRAAAPERDTPVGAGRRGWTRRARRLPADDNGCAWLETLPPLPAPRRLERDEVVDCAIIGTGFAGMAIARQLAQARPDWRVALIDAQRVGHGASGRCSGFLVDLVDFTSKMKPDHRKGYIRAARMGIERLRDLKNEHGFDADWDETGWIRGAVGEAGMRFLNSWPALLGRAGIAYTWLDRDAMRSITGSDLYQAGMRLPGYPIIHPGKMVRGLWESLPESVETFEESPVRSIQRVPGAGFRLEAGRPDAFFAVHAKKLFLATNGYIASQRFLADRVFPCFTFGSMTRVLTDQEQEALGGESEWGLLAMDPMGTTIRRTRDQRLLFRNTAYHSRELQLPDELRATMRKHHRTAFLARYPQLADVEFEYTWGGLMGTSHNSQIWFGEMEPGLFATAGFNAAGIAMGTAAGELLADLALGRDTELLRAVLDLPAPTWMPPEPFRGLGGRFLVGRKNAQAAEYI